MKKQDKYVAWLQICVGLLIAGIFLYRQLIQGRPAPEMRRIALAIIFGLILPLNAAVKLWVAHRKKSSQAEEHHAETSGLKVNQNNPQ